jgi:hypothetical protein
VPNYLFVDNYNAGSTFDSSSQAVPPDQWVCLEWQVQPAGPIDGGTGASIHVWMNDVPVSDLTVTNLQLPPSPHRLYTGALLQNPSGTTPAYDIWFDEVIIDTARIGCAK